MTWNCSTCGGRVAGHAFVEPAAGGDRILCTGCASRAADAACAAIKKRADERAAELRAERGFIHPCPQCRTKGKTWKTKIKSQYSRDALEGGVTPERYPDAFESAAETCSLCDGHGYLNKEPRATGWEK